jgi:hypothetical protein
VSCVYLSSSCLCDLCVKPVVRFHTILFYSSFEAGHNLFEFSRARPGVGFL